MPTDTTLTLYVTEIGREAAQSQDLNLSPRVDLADIRAWRFFHAAPDEFFLQYAGGFFRRCRIDAGNSASVLRLTVFPPPGL